MIALIIDDERDQAEYIAMCLIRGEFTTIVAYSAEAALERARLTRPDVILCDIKMPGMTGLELALIIKADPALKAIPLIAVTALSLPADEAKAMLAGFDHYITKPTNPTKFATLIRSYLGQHT